MQLSEEYIAAAENVGVKVHSEGRQRWDGRAVNAKSVCSLDFQRLSVGVWDASALERAGT